jgi:hypothetical protein
VLHGFSGSAWQYGGCCPECHVERQEKAHEKTAKQAKKLMKAERVLRNWLSSAG